MAVADRVRNRIEIFTDRTPAPAVAATRAEVRRRAAEEFGYRVVDDAGEALAALLPVDYDGFDAVWDQIQDEFRQAGAGGGLDADRELARTVYGITRAVRPDVVVETGVARGITARCMIEAGVGHLYSIDVPPRMIGAQSRIAVPQSMRGNWTYLEGTSRRYLPGLLRRLGSVDLFIHDSLHTRRNMRFEIARGWKALRPGGVLLADDVEAHDAFTLVPPEHSFVAQETDKPGMFGVAVKPA